MKPGDLIREKKPWTVYPGSPRIGLIVSIHSIAVKVLVDGKVITSLVQQWELIDEQGK